MTRKINRRLSFWVAGYYDDFNSARAIPDDANTPGSLNSYAHGNSHHGNPLNSEAFLNPRYRYAYAERNSSSSGNAGGSTDLFSTRYLHNQGMGEYITQDINRLGDGNYYESRSHLQYPSSLVANRQKYNWAGSDAYLKFSNGYDSQGSYWVPTGTTDSSWGRASQDSDSNSDGYGEYLYYSNMPATAAAINFRGDAHLTGVWSMCSYKTGGTGGYWSATGEEISTAIPNHQYMQVKSQSGMPFLHLRSYLSGAAANTERSIIHYEGDLNFIDDNDLFTIRMTAFKHNDGSYITSGEGYADGAVDGHWYTGGSGKGSGGRSPVYKLGIGYSTSGIAAGSTLVNQNGYRNSGDSAFVDPAIEWIFSPHCRYSPADTTTNAAHHKSYGCQATAGSASGDDPWPVDPIIRNFFGVAAGHDVTMCDLMLAMQDDMSLVWKDLEFKIDWTNEQYRVYCDGTEITRNQLMPGSNNTAPYDFKTSRAATDATGWMMTLMAQPEGSGQTVAGPYDENSIFHTLIDRVGAVRDITSPPGTTYEVVHNEWRLNSVINGVSNATLVLYDDDEQSVVGKMLNGDWITDYELLVFRSEVSGITTPQPNTALSNTNYNVRPIWRGTIQDITTSQTNSEIGGKKIQLKANDNTHILDRSLPVWEVGQGGLGASDFTEYREEEQQALFEALYTGATKLKISDSALWGDASQNYLPLNNQRMRLNSAHPIQVYNNEDMLFGPNEPHQDFESWPIAGFGGSSASPSVEIQAYFPTTGAGNHPVHSLANGTLVTIKNTGNSDIDGVQWHVTASRRGTVTHPNGKEVYDWQAFSRASGSSTPGFTSGTQISSGQQLRVFQQASGSAGQAYTTSQSYGGYMVWGFYVDGLVNTDQNLGIVSGSYISVNDLSDGAWKAGSTSANGTGTAPDTTFNFNGVWKVHSVQEYPASYIGNANSPGPGYWSGPTVGGSRRTEPYTKIILDCPMPWWSGGSGGTVAVASGNWSGYTAGQPTDVSHLRVAVLKGNANFAASAPYEKLGYSRVHSRWLMDLAKSPWFKKTFGIILKKPKSGFGWSSTNAAFSNGYLTTQITPGSSGNHTVILGQSTGAEAASNPSINFYKEFTEGGAFTVEFHNEQGEILGSGLVSNVTLDAASRTDTTTWLGWLGGAHQSDTTQYSGKYYGDFDICKMAFGVIGNHLRNHSHWDDRVVFRARGNLATHQFTESGYAIDLVGWDDELFGNSGQARKIGKLIDDCYILERIYDAPNTLSGKNGKGENFYAINDPNILTFTTTSYNGTARGVTGHSSSGRRRSSMGGASASTLELMWKEFYFLKKRDTHDYLTWSDLGLDKTLDVTSNSVLNCPPIPNTTTDLTAGSPSRAANEANHGHVVLTMPKSEGPMRTIPAGSRVKIRQISNNFKHCWALFADMRNDGTADASGGKKKKDFGLISPTTENYQVSLSFTDQFDFEGNMDTWIDFSAGEHYDMWNIDPTGEPTDTTKAYSHTDFGGSDSESNSIYHDWEDKAGAICLLDFSKSLNLNTEANGGFIGASSGGRIEIDDLVTESQGNAALIDNYWYQAVSHWKNTGYSSFFRMNPNARKWIQDTTNVTQSIVVGDTSLWVESAANHDHSGIGKLVAYRDADGGGQYIELHYYGWNGKATGTGPRGEDELQNVFTISADSLEQLQTASWNHPATAALYGSDISSWIEGYLRNVMWGIGRGNTSQGCTTAYTLKDANMGGSGAAQPVSWDNIQVTTTLAPDYPLRMMMNVEGFVKEPNGGSYYLHDKIRMLQTLSLTDSWMGSSPLNSVSDLANCPVTENYMSVPSGPHSDSFGGLTDLRGKTVLGSIKEIQRSTKIGDVRGDAINFNWCQGRDGRLDFRPTYNTGLVLNSTNSKTSKRKQNTKGIFTNVRVYFKGGGSFVDYPTPTMGDKTRWKIIEMPEIASGLEAEAIAKSEYTSLKKASHSIEIEYIKDADTDDKMLSGARYGYISDVTQQAFGNGGQAWFQINSGAASGAICSGAGMPFPGMVNALDGNLDGYNYNLSGSARLTGTSTASWGLHGDGVSDMHKYTPGTGNYLMQSGGTFLGNGRSTANDSSMEVDDIKEDAGSNVGIGWYDNFYWHGARSLSHAVQVVGIPNKMPKVSKSTGNELRVSIMLKPGQTGAWDAIDDALFYVVLTDVETEAASGHDKPYSRTGVAGTTYVEVYDNGFAEIAIPASYYTPVSGSAVALADARITLSVNCDYLRALLRRRCSYGADKTHTNSRRLRNAHETSWLNGVTEGSNTFNPNSIFPLGIRQYVQMGSLGGLYTMTYAPRLHIVDDVTFVPGTTVLLNDSYLGYASNTAFTIKKVQWKMKERQTETVTLTLEEDETNSHQDFIGYLFPRAGVSNVIPGGFSGGRSPSGGFGGGGSGSPSGGGGGKGRGGRDDGGEVTQPSDGSEDWEDKQKPQRPSAPPATTWKGGSEGPEGFADNKVSLNQLDKSVIDRLGNTRMDDISGMVSPFDANSSLMIGQSSRPTTPSLKNESAMLLNDAGTPSGGNVAMSAEGISFPGKSGHPGESGQDLEYHEYISHFNTPSDVASSSVTVKLNVSLLSHGAYLGSAAGASGETAILFAELECLDTGAKLTREMVIGSPDESATLVGADNDISPGPMFLPGAEVKRAPLIVFDRADLDGAGMPGAAMKLTLYRQPGVGSDTASYNNLKVHQVEVSYVKYSSMKKSVNSEFLLD